MNVDNGLLEILRATALSRRGFGNGQGSFADGLRPELARVYSWAIPNDEAIAALVEMSADRGILEVGAGTGYWAALLAQAGADIVATDQAPPSEARGVEYNAWHSHARSWFPVVQRDATEAAQAESTRALLLCWPPSQSAMGVEAVRAYRGDTVAYVGEWINMSTGNAELLELLEAAWNLGRVVDLPVWRGHDDKLRIFHRRDPGGRRADVERSVEKVPSEGSTRAAEQLKPGRRSAPAPRPSQARHARSPSEASSTTSISPGEIPSSAVRSRRD
jgi:hypothetical protein